MKEYYRLNINHGRRHRFVRKSCLLQAYNKNPTIQFFLLAIIMLNRIDGAVLFEDEQV